jgi:3-methyl-2-oxobutanoate hydroxymethyltransferase
VADLPFNSCLTVESALANTRELMDAGAEAIKAEGGRNILPQVRAIIAAGVPFLGHLGMLPQNVVAEGGYHVKGKTPQERSDLIDDAVALAEAGAFGIVLELITPPVAKEITSRVAVPTLGIGSGPDCDGEILVTTDLLGTSPGFIPRHVKKHWQFAQQMGAAVVEWKDAVLHPRSR